MNLSISPEQCRASRAFLGWTQKQLASSASISRQTVADFESGKRTPIATVMDAIRVTLLNERITFVDPDDHYFGGVKLEREVALSRPKRPKLDDNEYRFYSGRESCP